MTSVALCFRPERESRYLGYWRKMSRLFLSLLLGAALLAAAVVYLWEINYITAQGFRLRELDQKISALKEENEKLAVQVVEMKSMTNLSDRIDDLQMVPVASIIYFDVAGQVVAKR